MTNETLAAAFRATSYRVETVAGVFELRIGVPSAAFDEFLRQQKVSSWSVVTACNPGGVRADGNNALRQQLLLKRLQTLGYACWPARNIADDGQWPEEAGFLLLQVSEKEVCSLASEFFQLACVCGDVGSAPRLVWI